MGSLPPPSLPECLTALPGHASDALRNLRAPPPPSLSVSLSASPPVDPFALLGRSLATIPYRCPSPSSVPCFTVSLAAARSLGLSEARPLVFLLFPSRLRLLLVITTNLSRINSPSGINSSTVQAEKEKVIARGSGRANPLPPFPRRPGFDSPLCAPYGERERRYRGGMPGEERDVVQGRVESRRTKTVNVVTSRNEERPMVNNSSGA